MILEAVFQGPGQASMQQYLLEIILIIFGAFLLGYLFRFFLSDKHKKENAELKEELSQSQNNEAFQKKEEEQEALLSKAKDKIDQLNLSLSNAISEKVRIQAELNALKQKTEQKSAPAAPLVSQADDLTKIEGVGPKIASLLQEGGIKNYATLSQSSAQDIKAILIKAGPNYAVHDPTTWAEQAQLALKGEWDKLESLQHELKGGRKTH